MSNEFVTVKREELEQVLGYCEVEPNNEKAFAAYYALRAALEQPVAGSSEMVDALIAWASDLERGMQVFIPASSLRKIASALSAPKPAQQPEADKLLRQALEAMEVQGSEWVILERNAIAAIRKYLGEA